MLITNKINLKVSKKNINHLLNNGYDVKLGEIINIDVMDLNKGSHVKVKVGCDICKTEKEISFQKYIKNINNGGFYACSSKCAQQKVKKTNTNKFGKDYYTQTEEYKERVGKTSLEKYGCNHFAQNEEVIKKIKYTNLEKYGSKSPLSNELIREKIKNTNLEKYGVSNVFSSEEIKDKMRMTFMEKYGVDWSSKSDIVIQKSKLTNLKKYGVECVLELKEIKEKAKKSYFEKYGVNLGKLTDDMILKMKKNKKDKWIKKILEKNKNLDLIFVDDENKNYTFKCNDENHIFEIPFVNLNVRNSFNTTICTICNPIRKNFSGLEIKLLSFIKDKYNGQIIENINSIINPYELDIYLPDLKLAFEFNGLYWHSEAQKEKDYHLNKTKLCEKQGIKLIHIYEDDWIYKQDIVKSRILNLLNKIDNKIYARKCKIKEITDNKLVREFLEKNHIQDFVGSKIKIGLFYNDELVSLMTFGNLRKPMGQKSLDNSYEMLRFCNKLNTNVIGGASKLFKYFINNYEPNEIISYADRSWSNGDLYKKLGFNLEHETPPNYFYIINDVRKNRFNYRKDKLVKQGADSQKTEHEIMLEKRILRLYDSGSLKFVFK